MVCTSCNSVVPVQVETFGSMEKEEKVQFILEQMRLGLARKDYIRTQIISKKISNKFFTSTSESDIVQVQYMMYMYIYGTPFRISFLFCTRYYFLFVGLLTVNVEVCHMVFNGSHGSLICHSCTQHKCVCQFRN